MTTPTITKHMITLPPVGKGVLHWEATQGQQVERGAAIARFVVGTVSHTVNAPVPGRLYCVTPDGITMQGGVPIGRVHEGEAGTPAAVPQMPSNAPKTPVPPIESKAASTPVMPQIVHVNAPKSDAAPTRRNAHVEASITVLESGAGKVKKQSKKHRTKHTVYHVTEDQEGRVKALSFLFKSDSEEPNYSESEIVRAAVEHLLSQDKATQKAILSYNRDREKRAGYGAGWKRPGKR